MTFDLAAHRTAVRDWHQKLLAGGPGWHDYVSRQAHAMAKGDPTVYGDLPALAAAAIQKSAPTRAITTPNRRT